MTLSETVVCWREVQTWFQELRPQHFFLSRQCQCSPVRAICEMGNFLSLNKNPTLKYWPLSAVHWTASGGTPFEQVSVSHATPQNDPSASVACCPFHSSCASRRRSCRWCCHAASCRQAPCVGDGDDIVLREEDHVARVVRDFCINKHLVGKGSVTEKR